jgi:hypothetical protein
MAPSQKKKKEKNEKLWVAPMNYKLIWITL